ncbi:MULTISPECIES: class I SAM-dependent methyltransferase [Caballeronia]|jgi:SAM-dependent methyltransferase|uniref:Methyltransferase type 11 n=1 Tax=Caballeronia zhejiangensis TaxID=871203 RepID=A0A656QUK4_9BURK|nr:MULTISPECIES: class I SAM-dependent methyltransferase [Caballeronia]EKS70778.1 type 11 methyltransferase [Burkholderia sp. SJ98]KDR33817.1 methyltransferase type 11 [Caballeronia zhejiangensis]MDR5788684.1 class I SAM-dependent methyltransferase [Caballeronia sp. LP003]
MSFSTRYSQYYDLFYHEKNYKAEAAFVTDLLGRYGIVSGHLMDLGCGTGRHAAELAATGFSVSGIDMSFDMLARADARRTSLPGMVAKRLKFQQGDARSVRTEELYDAVVSLFHVASYQTTNADFMAMCHTAATHLPRSGLFLFDCWYGPAVLADPPKVRIKRATSDETAVIRIAEPLMRPHENTVTVNYTIMMTDGKTQCVETVLETHVMRYMFKPEVELMLDLSGFEVLDSVRWMGGELSAADLSATFVARKR